MIMIKYLVNGEELNEKEFDSRLEDSINKYCEGIFDDYLDNMSGNEDDALIEVCGLHFSASQIISECDPTAYRCLFANFTSEELEKAKDELECSDYIVVGDDEFSVEYIDDEDEDDDDDEEEEEEEEGE